MGLAQLRAGHLAHKSGLCGSGFCFHFALAITLQNMSASSPPSATASIRDSSDNQTLVEAGGSDLRDEQPRFLSNGKRDPWLVEFDNEDPYDPKVCSCGLIILSTFSHASKDLGSSQTLVFDLIRWTSCLERVSLHFWR